MILETILGKRRRSEALATKTTGRGISETPGVLFAGHRSSAGIQVTEEGALSCSGVFAAVMLLSRVTATLPLKVYRQSGRSKLPASTHPAYRVLGSRFNPEMTAAVGRRTLEFHRLTYGNSYAEIGWSGNGMAQALWPLEPWRVRPERDESGLYYLVDGVRKVAHGDMIHHTMLSWDGICGKGWVHYASESLGVALAAQDHAGGWFGRGARPGVILQHSGTPTPEARKEFKRNWDDRHQGPSRQGGTAVLWGGWQFQGTDGEVDPEKSQLVEQRRFSIEEVARWLNVPPPLLHELSRATFGNIEEQGLNFKAYSIGPSLVEQEQEYDAKLLSPPDLYCKHNLSGLLRGNAQARAAFYSTLQNTGVYSINDVRELEDENPIEGGDEHFVPVNWMPLSAMLAPPQPAEEEPPQQPVPDATEGMRVMLQATLERLARVEGNAIRRMAEAPAKFLGRVEEYYVKHHELLLDAVTPLAIACRMAKVPFRGIALDLVKDWCSSAHESLLTVAEVKPDELASSVARWAEENHARAGRFTNYYVLGANP